MIEKQPLVIQLSREFNIKLNTEIITIFFSNKYVEFKIDKKEIDYDRLIFPAMFQLISVNGCIEYPITLKNISMQHTLYIANMPLNKELFSLESGKTVIIKGDKNESEISTS